ncbi:type III-B CRISPR module-associated protein Cmr5 [Sulfurihydrogenibium subterraneum]|uniref:type III-B CRISPR module-associated protein Cmr5 n=1 Tax=Sulfurihydrogenibium subterraneum TaxID=171121 RepID=UPI00048A8BB9|nr:type III-B CRISPR module-associated protein Cmr5 [Sulfurihydrogenibium subterraneum]
MSNQTNNLNIESLIAKVSYELVSEIQNSQNKKKLKNLIDKALGVLNNNGVYAYYVYIISQNGKDNKEPEKIFLNKLKDLFKILDISFDENNKQQYFQNISNDLHKLLFLKQLLEKTLIYARYHAKALGD